MNSKFSQFFSQNLLFVLIFAFVLKIGFDHIKIINRFCKKKYDC